MRELLDSSAIHRRSQYPFEEDDEYISNYMASNDQNHAFENAVQELIDSISRNLAQTWRPAAAARALRGGGRDALNGV